MVDVKLKHGKLDFTPRYKNSKQYINFARSGKLFDEFDITPIRSEKRNIQFPVNKNIGPGKFNQGFIRQVDAYFKKTKYSTDPDVLRNKAAISNFLNDVGIRVEVEGERIGSKKVLPAIDRTTGDLPNIKNTLSKLDLSNLSVSGYVSPKTKNVESFFDNKTFKPKQGFIKPLLKTGLKTVPVIGTALGIADTASAYGMGIRNPIDLLTAYNISPEAALESKQYREDPEFRKKSIAELPVIQTEDFTSYFNGGIVSLKGVKK